MESILARALESTLKYWLKSFTRDQFKLQGHTVHLSNLDIDGDALHSSLGLPAALHVATARVGKLEILLPSVSNMQVEPLVVQIDRLDLVLEENSDEERASSSSAQSTSSKGSGYGFADKISDGTTIEISTVNLMLETRGAGRGGCGSTWKPPMASITMRNLQLYTTNEKWEVVNLKEARNSSNQDFIYVFRKLQWASLSIDLLPHPDMFMESPAEADANKKDEDGAKRVFFGGERFLDGISGEANITIQRTQLNDPLGLEVSLHISEAVCPALSEPGLRAFLRFLTGVYVCISRGDVDAVSQKRSTEAAGRSLVSIIVDHVFFCIKDAEFRLELLMQSLFFSRASVFDGENAKNLTKIMIRGLFLRFDFPDKFRFTLWVIEFLWGLPFKMTNTDTFSHPPGTLIQPSMGALTRDFQQKIPEFANNFCPPIYPLGDQHWEATKNAPFVSFHSLQVTPSPTPPSFTSQTVIDCQPLMIHLQEDSCLRISSFLTDGIIGGPGSALPDSSVNSLTLTLQALDLTVPLDIGKMNVHACSNNIAFRNLFSEVKLHIENLFLFESPLLKPSLLELEKDPACLCLWNDQPIDAGQKKWSAGASYFCLSLELSDDAKNPKKSSCKTLGSWKCIETKGTCVEVAMATLDGTPLVCIPPPRGIVRVGFACEQYLSNASVKHLLFVLDLCSYFGEVREKIVLAGKNNTSTIKKNESWSDNMISKAPSDIAVSFAVKDLQLRFLEDSPENTQGMPLVQFIGDDLFLKVSHRTLGGVIAVSSTMRWESVEVDCDNGNSLLTADGYPELRAVLWIQNKGKKRSNGNKTGAPFLDVNISLVIPSQAKDSGCHSLNASACVNGVRLAGGMNYTEALLRRFRILGPDGGPSEVLLKDSENLSASQLSKVFKPSTFAVDKINANGNSEDHDGFLSQLGTPDDVDVSIDLRNWLFALEGAQEMDGNLLIDNHVDADRVDKSWHTTFKSLKIKAKKSPKDLLSGRTKSRSAQKYPVELITIGLEGLQTIKPKVKTSCDQLDLTANGVREADTKEAAGVNLEARLVVFADNLDDIFGNWMVENLKFSIEQPIVAVVTKNELLHLALLCKSEINSLGRMTSVVLRALKLEGTISHTAIDHLSNLGIEGMNKMFSPSELSRGGSEISFDHNLSPHSPLRTVVASLEKEVEDAESKCTALIANLGKLEPSSQHVDSVKDLGRQIECIRSLLKELKSGD